MSNTQKVLTFRKKTTNICVIDKINIVIETNHCFSTLGGEFMNKEKKEAAKRTTENFIKKSEIEKAFILGYMVKRMQLKELEESNVNAPELMAK